LDTHRAGEPTALDRWALSEVHRVAREVGAALDLLDPARAGNALAGLIDDLSNWYVRRSRRRFWDGDPAALGTLYACLDVLTPGWSTRSWPSRWNWSGGWSSWVAARAEAGVKNRQPLARALSSAPGWVGLPEALRDEVRAELNVEALT
jgi:isoleucyl-tRNA synthetase